MRDAVKNYISFAWSRFRRYRTAFVLFTCTQSCTRTRMPGSRKSTGCPLHSEATRASHSPDKIDEYAFVVVLQIGQVVGEVGEVVADASLQVLANMTIDRGQRAAAPLAYIR